MLGNGIGLHIQIGPTLDGLTVNTDNVQLGRGVPSIRTRRVSLQCICAGIVDEHPFDLIRRDGRPPKTTVDKGSEEFGNRLGEARGGGQGSESESRDELFELAIGIELGPREDKSGGSGSDGGIEHEVKGLSDVDNVGREKLRVTIVELGEDRESYVMFS